MEIKVVVLATGDFGASVFSYIASQKQKFLILALITSAKYSNLKIVKIAENNNIPVFYTKNNSLVELINNFYKNVDLFIVVDFGKIIPLKVFNLYPSNTKFINIHPSLLPKLRGPSPIQTALLNNNKETGVSMIKMTYKTDSGPIIFQQKIIIESHDDYLSLFDKLTSTATVNLYSTLKAYLSNKIVPIPQNNSDATFTVIFPWSVYYLDFMNHSAEELYLKIKAFSHCGCFFYFSQKRFLIYKARIIEYKHNFISGTLIKISNKQLLVSCKNSSQTGVLLDILSIQSDTRKLLKLKDFLNGFILNKPVLVDNIIKFK